MKFNSSAMKLENAALQRFLALSERHMPKRYKILFSEQAPTQYFTSFCRMAELLNIINCAHQIMHLQTDQNRIFANLQCFLPHQCILPVLQVLIELQWQFLLWQFHPFW